MQCERRELTRDVLHRCKDKETVDSDVVVVKPQMHMNEHKTAVYDVNMMCAQCRPVVRKSTSIPLTSFEDSLRLRSRSVARRASDRHDESTTSLLLSHRNTAHIRAASGGVRIGISTLTCVRLAFSARGARRRRRGGGGEVGFVRNADVHHGGK